jgi:CRISPR-associated protein Csx17
MLAPLAETGWFDQFAYFPPKHWDKEDRLRAARAQVEEAIHRAVEEPGLEGYLAILEAIWRVNRSIILPGARRCDLEEAGRAPRPLPPLPARLWEEALRDGLDSDPAYRLGRAIGSILGMKAQSGGAAVGPVLEHMLPMRYDWTTSSWRVPDPLPSRPLRWTGLDPDADFRNLLWYRWLDSADLDRLPFVGARCASLGDIVALLRGEVDVHRVHRLAGLFALLDWQNHVPSRVPERQGHATTVSPAYAVLRLWFELGLDPSPDLRPPRDGEVVRLLCIGQTEQAQHAVARALSRLRVDGLPWDKDPRPRGKAVARFEPRISDVEAARLSVALLVPIAKEDTRALARRLWVPIEERLEVTT